MGLNYPKYHQISYDVPRICNVTSEDFSFVAFVDRNFSHPGRATYGILQVIPFVMLFLLNTYSPVSLFSLRANISVISKWPCS